MKEGGRVKLIVQPDDGLAPVLESIDRARKSLDFIIFRLDSKDIEKAAAAAVSDALHTLKPFHACNIVVAGEGEQGFTQRRREGGFRGQ